ncbi:N-acetyltransferase Eis [Streptomyces platensis]|uniref:Enhanced intracellular survival protein n=1 Tax=Streptomyces platensis TaxID=58346 RepID=A0ABX3XX96_STRPT|nr:Enhanced intracellular survival protein [Streptomyces platensis]
MLGHDLVTQVVFKHLVLDHPLRRQLADFRAVQVSDDTDWLRVRLLDVPRALTARGWFMDGEIVVDVDDPFFGEHGRYLLTVRDSKADWVPTDRKPDLSLDVRDLGSVHLGGTAPSTLVRAGRIPAHPGPTARARPPSPAPSSAPSAPRTACTGSDRALADPPQVSLVGLQGGFAVLACFLCGGGRP